MQNIPHVISFCLFVFFGITNSRLGLLGLRVTVILRRNYLTIIFAMNLISFFFFLFPNHCPENAQTEIVDGLRPGL